MGVRILRGAPILPSFQGFNATQYSARSLRPFWASSLPPSPSARVALGLSKRIGHVPSISRRDAIARNAERVMRRCLASSSMASGSPRSREMLTRRDEPRSWGCAVSTRLLPSRLPVDRCYPFHAEHPCSGATRLPVPVSCHCISGRRLSSLVRLPESDRGSGGWGFESP